MATIAVLEFHYPKRDALAMRQLGIGIVPGTALILALVLPRLVLLPGSAVGVQACATFPVSTLELVIAIRKLYTLKIFRLIRP